jgi:hypothetical protein
VRDRIKDVDLTCPECGAPPGRHCPFPIPGGFAGTYDYAHIARRNAAHDLNFPKDGDFDSEAPTPVDPIEPMPEIMETLETLHSPGIPTPTSDRVTRPIRPVAIREALRAAEEP